VAWELVDMDRPAIPELMPFLSPGRHRNPRKGACFMELASYLAGERWSDHPACTHPLLAALARDVNDHLGDEARRTIAPLIPEVIGLNRRDEVGEIMLTREVAVTALPVVSASRQRVTAVGLLCCERALNERLGFDAEQISEATAAALAQVPDAERWARDFTRIGWGPFDRFTRRTAPAIIHGAVSGIGEAANGEREHILVELLRRVIRECQAWMDVQLPVVTPEQWRSACQLTSR
jgi:hypothetical protein